MPKYLTAESIRKIKPRPARYKLTDTNVRGLQLVIEPSGTKTFVLLYKHEKRRHKYRLGAFGDERGEMSIDAARAEASAWRVRMSEAGEYPHVVQAGKWASAAGAAAERAAAPTMTTLLDEFRSRYLGKTKHPDKRLVIARKWLLDPKLGIGGVAVANVTRAILNTQLNRIVKAGSPVAASGLGRLLGQLFRWAIDDDAERWGVETSPAERLQKGSPHKKGDRELTTAEIGRLWAALNRPDLKMSAAVRHALRIQLLAGARAGEIAGARWEDVELTGKEPTWLMPTTKSGRPHIVPLSKQAVAEFKALHALTGDTKWCLPAAERVRGTERLGEREAMPTDSMKAHALGTAVRRCLKQIGIAKWRPHDLRRTMRSHLSRLGVSYEVAEKTIGHKVGGQAAQSYDRYDQLPARRVALVQWGAEVEKCWRKETNSTISQQRSK